MYKNVRAHRITQSGFTLVELMAVVAIVRAVVVVVKAVVIVKTAVVVVMVFSGCGSLPREP